MELEGSLKAFSLPEVLQFLSMGKMSGHLHLDREGNSVVLSIKAGRIVNSSSLARSRKLGEMLVHRGLLKRRDLEDILGLQRTLQNEKKLGELLIEQQLVREEDLQRAIRHQLEEEVWDLFSWEDGQFRFEHGDEDSVEDAVLIDIEPLLLEGSRRQDEWARIRRTIPEDSIVFGLCPLTSDEWPDLTPSKAEWEVLSSINGKLSVESIVNRCSLGRFDTCHILEQFLVSGLIHPVDPQHSAEARMNEAKVETAPEASARAVQLANFCGMDSAGKRLGGLFGARGRGNSRFNGDGPIEMVAPISQICAVVTAFANQALAQRDFNPTPEEQQILQAVWNQVLMNHPRADLVRVGGNVADPTPLEEFIVGSDFSPVVQECHEESVDAMIRTLKVVYRVAAQRLGERAVQKILQPLLDVVESRTTVQFGAPSDLAGKCARTIGVAA
jgi:hypothetical protein